MRVLFVAAELAPFAKVGGLADVAASLPKALAGLGVEAAVIVPRYRTVEGKADFVQVAQFPVRVGGQDKDCVAFRGNFAGGVPSIYFLDHTPYFDRPGVYGEGGGEYPDSLARFTFLSRGAIALCEEIHWSPDVIHVNDWHTALIPVYLRTGLLSLSAKTVLTIHNLAYQGLFSAEQAHITGLGEVGLRFLRQGDQINLLKGESLPLTSSPPFPRPTPKRFWRIGKCVPAREILWVC